MRIDEETIGVEVKEFFTGSANLSCTFSNVCRVTRPLPVKIIYLENLMLETTNCAMKTIA